MPLIPGILLPIVAMAAGCAPYYRSPPLSIRIVEPNDSPSTPFVSFPCLSHSSHLYTSSQLVTYLSLLLMKPLFFVLFRFAFLLSFLASAVLTLSASCWRLPTVARPRHRTLGSSGRPYLTSLARTLFECYVVQTLLPQLIKITRTTFLLSFVLVGRG